MNKPRRTWLKALRLVFLMSVLFVAAVAYTVWTSGDPDYSGRLDEAVVNDITQMNPIHVARVFTPHNREELIAAIRDSQGPLSIGGGRYSMGGQTAMEGSLHLDLRQYNQVVAFDREHREVTVQAGITWRKLQQYIDPYDLAVQIMQTYADFTVGGSLSVNVHGRYIGHGPLIGSVKSIQLVLADGSEVEATPTKNPQLFYAAIGGYGGIGVISEATLRLARNEKVARRTTTLPVEEYHDHFIKNIRDNKKVVFHNADLYPPGFENVRDVSWYTTDKPLTIEERLIPEGRDYVWLPLLVDFTSVAPLGKWFRESVFDPLYYAFDRVAWRNWEASYDVRELGSGDRSEKSYVLQEYFIPVDRIDDFIPKMRAIFQAHKVDVINVSLRHALPDSGSYLAWARQEVFAFVVYYRQGTGPAQRAAVQQWTREMNDAILSEGGSWYLPYQPHATPAQFHQAYPDADKFFAVKRAVDPHNRFQNKLWEKYYPSHAQQVGAALAELPGAKRGEEQTFLTLPEWYLVFNPNEYADFLEAGHHPSDFPFRQSIDEYWRLYDRVNRLTTGVYPENSEYQTMLWVIGVSTTAELMVKGAYENTLGRLSRWTANGETPEDLLIRQAHRAYAGYIYDEPWYTFGFWSWAKRIWSDTPFFGANQFRKLERKLAFTLEFGVKSLYARLIGYGAASAYAPAETRVTLHLRGEAAQLNQVDPRLRLVADLGEGDLIVQVPRWGVFTEVVPKLAARGLTFVTIAGNDDIALTALADQAGTTAPAVTGLRPLFGSRVMSDPGRQRWAYVARVAELPRALAGLGAAGLTLEHLYDY